MAGGGRWNIGLMDIPAPTPLAARPTVALGCLGGFLPSGFMEEAITLGFAPVLLHHLHGEMGGPGDGPREVLAATRQALGKIAHTTAWGAGAVVATVEEAAAFATAGFTWFTFDLAGLVDHSAASMSLDRLDSAVVAAEDSGCYPQDWHGAFLDREWRTASGRVLTLADEALARTAVKFGRALAHADQLQQALRTLWIGRGEPPDFELGFAGARTATSPDEFLFLTLESARRGLNPVSIAPSLGFAWQPGAGFPGEIADLESQLTALGEISALASMQKTGIHDAAGKSGILPFARRVLGDRCHVDCGGEMWLEVLGRLADSEPQVFREWLAAAVEAFPFAAADAAVAISEDDIRSLPEVPDPALRETFLGHLHGRQLLLSTFLHVMRGHPPLREAARRVM